ncbi:hypothetical protein ACFLQI_01895 [Candidatus Undinarchaeota archaeon]
MKVILLTQDGCDKCDYVKQFIPNGAPVEIMDAKAPAGMAEVAYHKLMGKHTPVLIMDDNEVVQGALQIKKKLIGLQ